MSKYQLTKGLNFEKYGQRKFITTDDIVVCVGRYFQKFLYYINTPPFLLSCITLHSLINQSSQNSLTLSKPPLVDQKQATLTLEAFGVVSVHSHKAATWAVTFSLSLLDVSPPLRCSKHPHSLKLLILSCMHTGSHSIFFWFIRA